MYYTVSDTQFKIKVAKDIMEFNQRSSSTPSAGAPVHNKEKSAVANARRNRKWGRIMGWASVVLLVSVAILLVALVASFVFNKPHAESRYVDNKHMQAVFLNGGQVYFGNITTVNSQYLTLSNIYYLRVNQTVQPNQSNNNSSNNNDVSLVKLGCELHGPADQMVINQSQVIFWENLKSDGQVAKAVAQYKQQNPNGQNCQTSSGSSTNTNSKQ